MQASEAELETQGRGGRAVSSDWLEDSCERGRPKEGINGTHYRDSDAVGEGGREEETRKEEGRETKEREGRDACVTCIK